MVVMFNMHIALKIIIALEIIAVIVYVLAISDGFVKLGNTFSSSTVSTSTTTINTNLTSLYINKTGEVQSITFANSTNMYVNGDSNKFFLKLGNGVVVYVKIHGTRDTVNVNGGSVGIAIEGTFNIFNLNGTAIVSKVIAGSPNGVYNTT